MSPPIREFESTLQHPAGEVFDWHLRPGAFQRLGPPWEDIRSVREASPAEEGSQVEFTLPLGPLRCRWVGVHSEFRPGRSFRDSQQRGPFARWTHLHEVTPVDSSSSRMSDRIEYAPPLGPLGRWVSGPFLRKQLARTFHYRHRTLARDLRRHAAFPEQAMRTLISGSSGLVGQSLRAFLTTGGDSVARLVRRAPSQEDERSLERPEGLEGFDAVVHLAGENIAGRRWSKDQKARIRDSRVHGTRALCEALASLENKPEVLVCASAVGYYGAHSGSDPALEFTEQSPRGDDFLARTCEEWEDATRPARDAGIRVVNTRFGVILSPRDGALKKMLLPFKLGAGGPLGSGSQQMSWIAIDDVVGAIHHILRTPSLEGPVNVCAPQPVTQKEFAKTLGKVLSRPAFAPMPGFVARIIFGEVADALLLQGQRVLPERLLGSGFRFDEPELGGALRHLLGREAKAADAR